MFDLCNTTKSYGTKIIDILNITTGKTLDNNNLTTKLDWNLNFLQYLRLRNLQNVWLKLHKSKLELMKIIDYQKKYIWKS